MGAGGRVATGLRAVAASVTRPLRRKHNGYVFIWTQVLRRALDRSSRRPAGPASVERVTLATLPARVPTAIYRELEPAPAIPTPPESWAWPRRFAGPQRRYPTSTRGQGALELPGGVVFGRRGVFGPDANGVFVDASALWPAEDERLADAAEQALAAGVTDLDGVTVSAWAGNAGRNYAHHLLQGVPRLDLVRRAFGLEADRFLMIEDAPRVTVEALAALDIPSDRLHRVPTRDTPAYRCEVLRVGTSPLFPEIGSDWTARFLHELFLPTPPLERSRRIYVQRGVPRRALLNEDDVIALLEPRGFEVLSMEGRSVSEQAELFASAEAVVSAHGAAMANTVFARPDTAVVELMGTNTATPAYAYLAWRRGLRYEMVMGAEPRPPDRWWSWQLRADTIADVRALRGCLDRLGLR
jgi:capsular polysaccharide biosynthesis protein